MNQSLRSARTTKRMFARGVLQLHYDVLLGYFTVFKSKHNAARRQRFLARHKGN